MTVIFSFRYAGGVFRSVTGGPRAGVPASCGGLHGSRFIKFAEAEEAAGRPWCADWAWVNPPISASTCPSYHRTYPNPELKPGFFRHEDQLPSR